VPQTPTKPHHVGRIVQTRPPGTNVARAGAPLAQKLVASASATRSEIALIRGRIFRATLFNWVSKVAILVIRFFLTPFILYRLGATQFGLLALITSVVGQGELFDLGIRAALVKYVAEHYSRGDYQHTRSIIATSLWLYSALGLLAFAFAAVLAPFFPHLFKVPSADQATATQLVLLMGLQVGFTLPSLAPGAVLWGLHKYHLLNALVMTSTVLSSAIMVVVLLAGGGLVAMIAACVPITVAMLPLGMLVLRLVAPEIYPNWRDARRELFRPILSFSSATFVIDAAFGLQMKTDEVIIGAVLPVSAVTPYSIARRLSALPQMVVEQTVGVFLPIASELHALGDMERLRSLYLSASRMTLAVCLCLAIVLIALARPLLTLWVGAEYAQYAPIVVILAVAGLAETSHWIGGAIFQGIARHRIVAVACICAALANLGLSILLVRPYGLIGVALGTLIPSTILSLCFFWPYASWVLGVPARALFKQVFLPAFLPAVPMAAVLYGASLIVEPSGIILTAATAAAALATYTAVYLIFCADVQERQLIRSILANLQTTISLQRRPPQT